MPGRPQRTFEPEIISELVDIRIKEQVPWKELPERYLELLPDSVDEASPDWRTLRREMMRDIDAYVMPARVHKKMRARISEEFDKADLGAMMVNVLMSKYGEWNLLHGRMLRHAAMAGLRDDTDEKQRAPKFGTDDRDRMDKLGSEVLSVLFRITEMMRSVNIADNSIFQLMEDVDGNSPGVRGYNDQQLEEQIAVQNMIEGIREDTTKMMDAIDDRHKTMGVGSYRVRPERELDLIEDS